MLISIAIDFRYADVATRERFHLSEERLTQLYRTARTDVITESALIATCNRTELYAWVDSDNRDDIEDAVQLLARRWMRTRSDGEQLLKTATRREGADAASHVIRIASGLESQVLGDGQILGQLKAAYKRASRGDAAGPVLHRLFETALRAGKRVQTETSLTAGRNSVGAEAAITASLRFGNLENARCVVIGAGKTGARAAKQLHKLGARDIVVINRTPTKAQELAGMVHGRAAAWDAMHVEAAMADVVIVATGSEVPVITAPALARARSVCGVGVRPAADGPLDAAQHRSGGHRAGRCDAGRSRYAPSAGARRRNHAPRSRAAGRGDLHRGDGRVHGVGGHHAGA